MKNNKILLLFGYIIIFTSIVFCKSILVISHEDLFSSTWYNKYASLKSNVGYTVSHVEIGDGDGLGQIKFLIDDLTPDFVVLIGDASEAPAEQRNIASSSNGNYIPFYYEMLYDPFNGPGLSAIATDDYLIEDSPETYIGRIPASSVQEVDHWVDKLIESTQNCIIYQNWKNSILFVTGDKDHPTNGCKGIQRDVERDSLLNYIQPIGMTTKQLNSADFSDPYGYSETRADSFESAVNYGYGLINGISVGADWVHFMDFYWYDNCDWDFNNVGKYPFIFGMSCSVGKVQQYDNGNVETIVQKLLFLNDAGIIGTIAPTWITGTWGVRHFSYKSFDKLIGNDYSCIGKSLKDIKTEFESENPNFEYMSRAMLLFGDPSTTLPIYQYKSSNITSNTIWQGSIVVENDISVSSGVTLTIQPGTGVFFKDNAQLKVYGTLIAQGNSSYHIKFSAASENPTVGSWDGVQLNSGSTATLKYCEIEYAQSGIRIGGSNPLIEGCYIHDNSNYGIYMYSGAEPTLKNNTIVNNNSAGVNCTDYSEPTFGPAGGNGYNRIIDNDYGIIASYNSFVELGYSTGYGYIYALNSLFNNDHYDAEAIYGATIVAMGCWWGSPNPSSSQFCKGIAGDPSAGAIYYSALASDPGGGSPLAKSSVNVFADKWIDPDNVDTDDPESLWKQALYQRFNGEVEAALIINKDIVERFPSSEYASKALCQVFHISEKNNMKGLKSYLKTQTSRELPSVTQGTVVDLSILKYL